MTCSTLYKQFITATHKPLLTLTLIDMNNRPYYRNFLKINFHASIGVKINVVNAAVL